MPIGYQIDINVKSHINMHIIGGTHNRIEYTPVPLIYSNPVINIIFAIKKQQIIFAFIT